MKCLVAAALAVLVSLTAAYSQAEGAGANVVFPPENASECSDNTALSWNGRGNVRCATVMKALPELGSPLYLREFSFGSVDAYNAGIRSGVSFGYGSPPSVDGQIMLTSCLVARPATSERMHQIATASPQCLAMLCAGQMQRMPRMTDVTGVCVPNAVHADCSHVGGSDIMFAVSCMNVGDTLIYPTQ